MHARRSRLLLLAAMGLVVSAFAALLSMHYGRIGYMPLDQSMVFDGGYRILTGQLPFRDFVAPAGALPSVLQAAFFAVWGTSWFAYCLHAAVLNGLFTLLVYGFVRLMGGGALISWAWAALSGVMFCPAVGTPLVDHHAYFFGFAALVAMVAAGRVLHPPAAVALSAAVAPLLAASILSKPTVVPFLIPLFVLAVLRTNRVLRRSLLVGSAVGIVGTLAITLMTMRLAQVSWDQVAESLWKTSWALGQGRMLLVSARARELRDAVFLTPLLTPVAALLGGGWLVFLGPIRGKHCPAADAAWPDSLLSTGLLMAGIGFALITFRTTWTSWGFLFAAAGGIHASAKRILVMRPLAWRILTIALLFLGFHDAARFQSLITAPRSATILVPSFVPPAGERVRLPEALADLQWATPPYDGYPWQDLSGVVEFFSKTPGDFWLLGDSSILYALTGRPSLHPTLWMLPPPGGPPERPRRWQDEWESRLIRNLDRHRVRYVVLEHSATQMGVSLDTFSCVAEATRRALIGRRQIGAFTILEVRPQTWRNALQCSAARSGSQGSGENYGSWANPSLITKKSA